MVWFCACHSLKRRGAVRLRTSCKQAINRGTKAQQAGAITSSTSMPLISYAASNSISVLFFLPGGLPRLPFGASLANLSCRICQGPLGFDFGGRGTSTGASEDTAGRKSSPRKSGRTAGLTGAIGVTKHRINSDGRAAAFGANQNSGLDASSSSERAESPGSAQCRTQSACVSNKFWSLVQVRENSAHNSAGIGAQIHSGRRKPHVSGIFAALTLTCQICGQFFAISGL